RRRLLFSGAADLAHHQDRLGLRVLLKELQNIHEVRAGDRVAANAHARRLPQANVAQLPNPFVGQSAAAADDADWAGFVNVTRHDADLALPRSDNSGTVRPDEPARPFLGEAHR